MKLSVLHPTSNITLAAFYTSIISPIILLPYVFWDGTWQSIQNPLFVYSTMGNIGLNTIAHLLLLTTIRRFDISYVATILATSPLIYTAFSIVFLGESPGLHVFLAMLLIAGGAILVELSRGQIKCWKSFLLYSGWPPLMGYLCLAAGATVFSKLAVSHGDPEAYVAMRYTGLSLVFLVIYFVSRMGWVRRVITKKASPSPFRIDGHSMVAGLFLMAAVVCEMNALQLTNMANVEAITKLSIVMTLLVDTLFISKKFIPLRWAGAALILIGGAGVILL